MIWRADNPTRTANRAARCSFGSSATAASSRRHGNLVDNPAILRTAHYLRRLQGARGSTITRRLPHTKGMLVAD